MRRNWTACLAAAGLAAIVILAPARGEDATAQARSQVERGLAQHGIVVPGGVAALSDRQVLELLMEINTRDRQPGRVDRMRRIIARE